MVSDCADADRPVVFEGFGLQQNISYLFVFFETRVPTLVCSTARVHPQGLWSKKNHGG